MTLTPSAFKPTLRRSTRWSIYLLSAVVALVALAIPVAGFAYVSTLNGFVADQVAPLPPNLALDDLARYRSYATDNDVDSGPIVLTYHGIEAQASSARIYSVTPQQFANHMAMLAAAGFETLSRDGFIEYMNTGVAPPRSVLLTFDDGAKTIWTLADPVLGQYGFNSVAFVATDVIGQHQPYYLTWEETRGLAASGRWAIESHTHLGHERIAVNAAGDTGAHISSRQWLIAESRYETLEEWHRRAVADFETSAATLIDHGLAAPVLLSYPFSEGPESANDVSVGELLSDEAADRFLATFTNHSDAGTVSQSQIDSGEIVRMEVFSHITADDLFEKLVAAREAQP